MHRRTLLLPILLAAALAACESAPKPAATGSPDAEPSPVTLATWTPDAAARVVTIQRQSAFTIVEKDRDLFILRTEGYLDGRRVGRVTWVLSTPPAQHGPARYALHLASAELDSSGAASRAGDRWRAPSGDAGPGEAIGWAIIDRVGYERKTHAVTGEIEILSMDTDRAGISVRLDTLGVEDTLVFEGDCMRVDRPRPIGTAPIETRSGLPNRAPDVEEPKKTDPVWPWNEIFRTPDFRGDE